jgi:hypothetical protein
MSDKWDKKSGVDQEKTEKAAKSIQDKNLKGNFKDAWENLKGAFSGDMARGNTPKQNEQRKNSGGYYKK